MPDDEQILELQEFRRSVEDSEWAAPVVGGFPKVPPVESLPTAAAEFERELRVVKNVPGSSASILYVCLADNADPPAYSWVQVATG